ncbi:DNA-3-methyladenine glycosylase II [Thiogranum longum]|uniref:DNA-3-methyladenine glycosylase II n=1 Tax=Thiogranum longum TaxID=1537524 RepID=A0A4R1HMU3_9GAMM|nr:DNA-3-methyladenine glycosylase [Thiogranum longum]TCK18572.1 DNA-3-methyladenine glycosylase II [Thiogranum longum]
MKKALRQAERYLAKTDPVLARMIEQHGPCTLQRDPHPRFHTLVWAIVNQQLSVKAARSIEGRLLKHFDSDVFHPQHFYRVRETTLRRCGLSGAKIRYIREIARRVRQDELDLHGLDTLDDERVAERLMDLPGIGQWTAEMLLMFSLGRMDVLPVGDLALRKSMRVHWGLGEDVPHDTYIELAEAWRPYRTVASWYIWAAVD